MSASSTPHPVATKQDVSINLSTANLYSILLIPGVLLLAVPFGLIWSWRLVLAGFGQFMEPLSLLPALIGGIVIHELLHGIGWAIFGRLPWSKLRFGFKLSTLTPYAHVTTALPVRAYRWGAALPCLVLGILPIMIGTVSGSGWLLAFGLFFTLAAAGDLLILWVIRRIPTDKYVEDHPSRAGCFVLDGSPADA